MLEAGFENVVEQVIKVGDDAAERLREEDTSLNCNEKVD